MADVAPELHAKTLLTSIDSIGKAVAAIDEAAEKLASIPPSAPASVAKLPPAPPSK